ncbi:MAG: UDP-N-acetylmuramate dehydrogenase [Planctomycetes bacterium]|nr:UDP-N-acetylmuramate dehydrogenase [Planctomycetota bacterium]
MTITRHGVPLARRTTLEVGGTAAELHIPESLEDLRCLLGRLHERRTAPHILGGGANTLFPDGELRRPVVSTELLRGLEARGSVVRAECGVRLNALVRAAMSLGLGGLEGLVGIPGTAGGAVVMNAGGGGWSFGDRVRELGLIPLDGGPIVRVRGADVPWRYRSAGLQGFAVAWVDLELVPCSAARLRDAARELMLRKSSTQPLGEASAGCAFKNPAGASAGRWIDELGLKGLRRGGARVSERHANFIVTDRGSASARDVLDLLEDVRGRVERAFGVRLETEIVLV